MASDEVRREVRWWMAWRSMNHNIKWLEDNRKSITTVHPAHHLVDVELDGTLKVGKDYAFDQHVKPYLDQGLDVMPCIDFVVSSREACQSAIYQGLVQGDSAILASLRATVAELAKFANDQKFSGFVIDYEPSFAYTLEHVEALQKFVGMLKAELSKYDKEFAELCAPDAFAQRRRVGVCVSNWGIIDVLKEDFAKVYQTPPDEGGADFLMSMAYTYYPPEAGSEGFAELAKRCAVIASLFGTRATIGFGVASNNKLFGNWFSSPDDNEVANFVRSVPKYGASAISLWGMWYRQEDPDSQIDKFSQPLAEFLSDGGAALCSADAGLVAA